MLVNIHEINQTMNPRYLYNAPISLEHCTYNGLKASSKRCILSRLLNKAMLSAALTYNAGSRFHNYGADAKNA
jgi:hypothetical protein